MQDGDTSGIDGSYVIDSVFVVKLGEFQDDVN